MSSAYTLDAMTLRLTDDVSHLMRVPCVCSHARVSSHVHVRPAHPQVLIDGFLESLSDPLYFSKGIPQQIIAKILRKDQLMQQAVNRCE